MKPPLGAEAPPRTLGTEPRPTPPLPPEPALLLPAPDMFETDFFARALQLRDLFTKKIIPDTQLNAGQVSHRLSCRGTPVSVTQQLTQL